MTGIHILRENPLLLMLFIIHVLSDFHWQSQDMADRKSSEWFVLGKHLVIVGIPLACLTILLPEMLSINAFIFLSHAIIDSIKRMLPATWIRTNQQQQIAFVMDQLAHLIAIVLIYQSLWTANDTPVWWFQWEYLLRIILFILIITKPMNIVFKLFFSKYQVKELSHLLLDKASPTSQQKEIQEEEETVAGAGALIGNLERIIMGLFLILGQYAAIGLVFTAKSIARYDRISKSQAFAEYYLIGSLFSIISVLIVYLVIF